jgi:hypothetical protein
MSDGFQVDADRLTAQAGQFEGLVGRAGAIHRELADTLGAIGRCWGTDTVGQSFDSIHTGPADDALGRIGSLPDQLGSVGTRFADTAAAYRGTDTGGATTIDAADDDH